MRQHDYHAQIRWTGNTGQGTADYRGYSRQHQIRIEGKAVIEGSSDRPFRGDPALHNPEDLLLSALSSCHMLSYLHLAAVAGLVVTAYVDEADGHMVTEGDGGHFTEVVLRPCVTLVAGSDAARAEVLHEAAHHACFIANSVNFPVRCEPRIVIEST
jgi:organic hydroperoxide reductase OsmC/OhrA